MPRVKANGIEIEYESFGRDNDPTILLIMGFAAQMIVWPVALCEGLAAKGFRVIRFDNRDIGKSTHLLQAAAPMARDVMGQMMAGQKPSVPYALDDMAADAAGLLDVLGIAQAHIVGASMGGMIAQLVAIHFPTKTRSLVSIMSTTAKRGLPQGTPEAMAALTTPPASDSREDRIQASIRVLRALASPGFPTTDVEFRQAAEATTDRVPWEATGPMRQMAAIISAQPRNDMLKTLRMPCLVIHGVEDPILPLPHGQDTAASIPGAQMIEIAGMAHDFARSLVPLYIRHIGDFAAKVEATRPKA